MNDILVSIIIVNYSTCALTCACIDSIFQNVHSCKFEVILVDNASSDNSVVEIKRRYESSVKLVASDYNLGFGRANNWGTKHASGQYLFLLNSDTVLRNDPFPYFLEFLHARENLGALGTYLKDGNGIYTKSGGNFYSMRKYLMMGVKRLFLVPSNEEIPLSNTSRKVDYVIGADLFIRKELFEQIGMFSKHIFMYFEDVELCKRLYDAGYHSYLIPGPEIIHFVKSSSTSQFSRVYNTASLMYCIQKEHSYVGFFFFQIAYFLLKAPLLLNIKDIRKEWEYITSIFKYKQYLVK